MNNVLKISLLEFKLSTKPFRSSRKKLGPVLLAYESNFLSIESGDTTVVMRAEGNWSGRATFSPEILRAISSVPPNQDPLIISYADNHLLIGNITAKCQWSSVNQPLMKQLESPSLIDMLALEKTLPRSELAGTDWGKKVRSALEKSERRITKAASYLEDLDISEADIRELIEKRINNKLNADK